VHFNGDLGARGGSETHVLTALEVPSHTHQVVFPPHSHTAVASQLGVATSGIVTGAITGTTCTMSDPGSHGHGVGSTHTHSYEYHVVEESGVLDVLAYVPGSKTECLDLYGPPTTRYLTERDATTDGFTPAANHLLRGSKKADGNDDAGSSSSASSVSNSPGNLPGVDDVDAAAEGKAGPDDDLDWFHEVMQEYYEDVEEGLEWFHGHLNHSSDPVTAADHRELQARLRRRCRSRPALPPCKCNRRCRGVGNPNVRNTCIRVCTIKAQCKKKCKRVWKNIRKKRKIDFCVRVSVWISELQYLFPQIIFSLSSCPFL